MNAGFHASELQLAFPANASTSHRIACRLVIAVCVMCCLSPTRPAVSADDHSQVGFQRSGSPANAAASALFPLPVPPESSSVPATRRKEAASRFAVTSESSTASSPGIDVPTPLPDEGAPSLESIDNVSSKLDAERRWQEKEIRYQQLQDRLRRMIGLWTEQEHAQAAAGTERPAAQDTDQRNSAASNPEGSAAPAESEFPANISATHPDSLLTPETPDDNPPALDGASQAPRTKQTDAPPSAVASKLAAQLAGSTVIEGPVDRIGLADNLYGMGEIAIALQMYDNVDTSQLSAAEKYWVTFQTASCLRRLKRAPEAQERYRRLAGEKEGGWLAAAARWWLDHIDERAELESQITGYQKRLISLKDLPNVNAGK